MNGRGEVGAPGGPTRRWRDETGKSAIRGLIALAVLGGLVYGGMKFIPVRASAYQFNDAVREEVVYAGGRRRSTDENIRTSLRETAVALGLPIQANDIKITRSGTKYIVIEVDYTVRIEFVGGYTFDWPFHVRQEGPLF